MKYVKLLTFIFLLVTLFSCQEECESQATSIVRILFFDKSTGDNINPNFTKIYGLDAQQDLELNGNLAEFPLSLQGDKSVYIFEKDAQKDTLTLEYNRNFYFQSNRCGFVVEIQNLQLNSSETTFEILSNNTQNYEISIAY